MFHFTSVHLKLVENVIYIDIKLLVFPNHWAKKFKIIKSHDQNQIPIALADKYDQRSRIPEPKIDQNSIDLYEGSKLIKAYI